MHRSSPAFLALAVLLLAAPLVPVDALPDSRVVTQVADSTLNRCLRGMDAVQQGRLQQVFFTLQSRMTPDPEGRLSMAYLAMVTAGASPEAQAAVAAWGARRVPQSLCLVNNLGWALVVLKDYPNAEKILLQALAIEPESLEAMINLGNLYLDTDRDEEARRQYEAALKVDPEYVKAWEGLYGYWMKKRDYRKAMEIIARVKPAGFILRGRDGMQAAVDAARAGKELEQVHDGDSLEAMERKIERIVETKPLNVAPIVEEVDPAMAAKIRDAMGSLEVRVEVPDQPWPYDFGDARSYYITLRGYEDTTFFSEEHLKPEIDPAIIERGEQIAALSDAEKDRLVDNYLQNINSALGKLQGMDLNDPAQMMQAMKQLQGSIGTDPFSGLPAPGGAAPGRPAPGGQPPRSTLQDLGTAEKPGLVTRGNFNNYAAHRMNYQRYFRKITDEFTLITRELGDRFDREMAALREAQDRQAEQMARQGRAVPEETLLQWTRQRNSLRDGTVQEFGSLLSSFYRAHVQPAIRKVEENEALYVRNMANPNLRNMQAEQIKQETTALLGYFANARAPIDGYEPEGSAAQRQLEAKIEQVRAGAPKAGQTLPQLQKFEDGQKSLLEKVYEDTKFESQVGLVKLSFENAELTLSMNDALHDRYMDLGVNLKDFSASLTEGEGCDMGFKVSVGEAGPLKGVEASVGLNNRAPGQKTTLYFDDGFNVVDAQVTKTTGAQGVSASVSAADLSVEGGVKVETTAEGTSSFVSSIKASAKDWTVWEKQYREEMPGGR